MDRVIIEPLGWSGDEQAFRVSTRGQLDAVVYNHRKLITTNCSFCGANNCKHEMYIEEYIDYVEDNPNYMALIHWAWHFDDGNYPYNFRVRYYAVWDWISNGLMRKRHRTDEETSEMLRSINYQLNNMDMLPLSLLTLWRLPRELENMEITVRWDLATVYATENGLMNFEWE